MAKAKEKNTSLIVDIHRRQVHRGKRGEEEEVEEEEEEEQLCESIYIPVAEIRLTNANLFYLQQSNDIREREKERKRESLRSIDT